MSNYQTYADLPDAPEEDYEEDLCPVCVEFGLCKERASAYCDNVEVVLNAWGVTFDHDALMNWLIQNNHIGINQDEISEASAEEYRFRLIREQSGSNVQDYDDWEG